VIEVVFTLDYEIYGNGEGSLRELVYEPARRLKGVFDEFGAKFLVFVETAELEKIDGCRTDTAIEEVKAQVRDFHHHGFEIGLHLHPQWCNARYENGRWELDYREYNLCTLPEHRIQEIVRGAIDYLRGLLAEPGFVPLSFRAGNWLFQPSETAARVLAREGMKIDSSVFKGGVQHKHKLDYRGALQNGCFWAFNGDVLTVDAAGPMLEIPIYTKMVPFWKMATSKRLGLQQHGSSGAKIARQKWSRLRDFARFYQPLKFDFCRMTLDELMKMVETAIREDEENPAAYKPIVAIGHTKDLVDLETVQAFLAFLKKKGITVSTLREAYPQCRRQSTKRP
jgi:hypothetical protein